jgi:hypothetical protein
MKVGEKDKREKRYVVEAVLDTEGGELKTFASRPLTKSQAEDLCRAMRGVSKSVSMHARRYTEEQLEDAERLAMMGQEKLHLGEVE